MQRRKIIESGVAVARDHKEIGKLDCTFFGDEAGLQDRAVFDVLSLYSIITAGADEKLAAFFSIQESAENGWRIEGRQTKPVNSAV